MYVPLGHRRYVYVPLDIGGMCMFHWTWEVCVCSIGHRRYVYVPLGHRRYVYVPLDMGGMCMFHWTWEVCVCSLRTWEVCVCSIGHGRYVHVLKKILCLCAELQLHCLRCVDCIMLLSAVILCDITSTCCRPEISRNSG